MLKTLLAATALSFTLSLPASATIDLDGDRVVVKDASFLPQLAEKGSSSNSGSGDSDDNDNDDNDDSDNDNDGDDDNDDDNNDESGSGRDKPRIPGGSGCDDPGDVEEHASCSPAPAN